MLNLHPTGDVLMVELEHGKVNALDLELLHAIIDAFHDADEEQPIVLTGAGRAFSAGVDLLRIVDGGPAYVTEFLRALSDCFLAVFDHPAPVVAAVNGPAIAGGCVLAAACDRRLISRGPIGLAELAVGVPFPVAALEIMRSVLGTHTNDLVLTARSLDPDAALACGLVDGVVRDDELRPAALAEAQRLAALPPGVFTLTKQQLRAPAREQIAQRADDDLDVRRLWASDDVLRAIGDYMATLRGGTG